MKVLSNRAGGNERNVCLCVHTCVSVCMFYSNTAMIDIVSHLFSFRPLCYTVWTK